MVKKSKNNKIKTVLFVCTGNVFRSLSAERCLRQYLLDSGLGFQFKVISAGTKAEPQAVAWPVFEELRKFGIDVSDHKPTRLNKKILDSVDLVVAMSTNHRDFIKDQFNVNAVLFKEICFGLKEPLLDVNEAIKDYRNNIDESEAYLKNIVDFIHDSMPDFAKNFGKFIK